VTDGLADETRVSMSVSGHY